MNLSSQLRRASTAPEKTAKSPRKPVYYTPASSSTSPWVERPLKLLGSLPFPLHRHPSLSSPPLYDSASHCHSARTLRHIAASVVKVSSSNYVEAQENSRTVMGESDGESHMTPWPGRKETLLTKIIGRAQAPAPQESSSLPCTFASRRSRAVPPAQEAES